MATGRHREGGTGRETAQADRLRVAAIYALLLGLLALTMGVASVDLGWVNVVANLTIATVKTVLILWFFMHLREMGPVLRFFAVAAAIWLGILFAFGLSDWLTRGV